MSQTFAKETDARAFALKISAMADYRFVSTKIDHQGRFVVAYECIG